MIIGHMSDTHLGAYAGREEEREEDYYDAFREAIELFIKDRVGLVIHSGDILDTPKPYGTAMRVLVEGVKRLDEKGIRFLFTLGEHDISNVPSTPHPYILDVIGVANYVGKGEPLVVGDVTVVGLHKYKRTDADRLHERLKEVAEKARQADGKKKVLVLHQGLHGLHEFVGELSRDEIPTGFDYYAMGHFHVSYKFRHGGGLGAYPGATHWVSWRDPDESFVNIVDLSGDEPTISHVRLKSVRPKMERHSKLEALSDVIEELVSSVQEAHKKPCLLLNVEASRPFDPRPFEDALRSRYIVTVKQTLKEAGAEVLHEAPDVDAELMRLAENAMGSREKAEFALLELLRVLNGDDWRKEALELIWRVFKEGRLR